MARATRCGKGQPAGLGTQAPVAAAASQHGTELALPRHGHTQRPVDKAFQLHRAGLPHFPDLPKAHLPGEHHALGAQLPQQLGPRRGVEAHLGGGVKGQLGRPLPQQGEQPHVLDQHRVHRQGAQVFCKLQGLGQLFFF